VVKEEGGPAWGHLADPGEKFPSETWGNGKTGPRKKKTIKKKKQNGREWMEGDTRKLKTRCCGNAPKGGKYEAKEGWSAAQGHNQKILERDRRGGRGGA